MPNHLLLAVHLVADGMGTARYHGIHQGEPEWPPAPARVFQALVAGVARGLALPEDAATALQWVEQLPPPLIAAPAHRRGQAVSLYVPNNDADALADPSDVSSIRTAKQVQPSLFDGSQPILYAWPLPDDPPALQPVLDAVHQLYQLGRGVDMAWADAHVLDDDALHRRLRSYRGQLHRPAPGVASIDGGRSALPCPTPGSLLSLVQRHRAPRLRRDGAGRKARVLFTNPPKPRFVQVAYAPQQRLALYELRTRNADGKSWPWPLHRAAALVECLRDAAAARLHHALGPAAAPTIERCLIGRDTEGRGAVPLAQRVRILPLPSIGAQHADQAIRRVAVEVPPACLLAPDDIAWAFSGLDRVDPATGEASAWVLTVADNSDMLAHYTGPARHWQTVTAAVLPEAAGRRRIDPTRQRDEVKGAAERQQEEARAVAAVHTALRHAGLVQLAVQVAVQREPFKGLSRRAEAWAEGTRFAKERLWHVALAFNEPVSGPLALGDGRFLGLGMLAPTHAAQGRHDEPGAVLGLLTDGVFALQLTGGDDPATAGPVALARVLRRALMSRTRQPAGETGDQALTRYVGGHAEAAGVPDDHASRHLAYHWDDSRSRWLVLAPHRLQHRAASWLERQHLAIVRDAFDGLGVLLAGHSGRFEVQPTAGLTGDDPVLTRATRWVSVTPYTVTRHRRLASAEQALVADVLTECQRWGLPQPEVQVLQHRSVPGQGLQGHLQLRFAAAIDGPVALGRTALLGGGLFAAASELAAADPAE